MKTVIIGSGAAGLIAAGFAGQNTLVLERNEKCGKKLYITGKGRCNVTNECAPTEFTQKVVRGEKFVLGAINRFSPYDTIALIESFGVPLKTERGNRVFPISDKASDVIKALYTFATTNGAEILLNSQVTSVKKNDGKFHVQYSGGTVTCDNLIIATGGLSYPQTGSDGFGYEIAKQFGHTITPLLPSLVAIEVSEKHQLSGLTLKNVSVSISALDKKFFGEMLFTENGVSGPIVLTLTAYANRLNVSGEKLYIDLKPALDHKTLDARVLSDFNQNANKNLMNALGGLMPKALIPIVIERANVDGYKKVNLVTRDERTAIVNKIKALDFTIKNFDCIERAVVTSGGVDLNEVNPRTMQSKLVSGLYFAGEVLDIDALTGGFNIQLALSTGAIAGKSVSETE